MMHLINQISLRALPSYFHNVLITLYPENKQCILILYLMSYPLRCLSYCCCDILCCECNKYIFPAPGCEYKLNESISGDDDTVWEFKTFPSEGRTVPYLQISNIQSRNNKKCFIYFHGNGEDIGFLGYFLQPIMQALNITFYAIEYPSYGQYYTLCSVLISNKIKQDALYFYDYLMKEKGRSKDDIFVMGRSIGSGGASYLAAHRPVSLLILMSPFDTIKKVAQNYMGCAGSIVKQHFNNEEQLAKFNGKLLVIHGQRDQVIHISHARNLVREYERRNDYKNRAVVVWPELMTHNNFKITVDVIAPIIDFLKENKIDASK